ncbi:hypothetical protein OOU_Y34scaffold00267g20 [Pyricularia oryzae Y34]|uniref:Uncharacterized protein n=2 Tax=Pyricularia oryzae TaxID=318829 RepID=A0AA97P409_PYRO3|nr:hypothetical protein OOU_Y34scaffold00267g20 [Pyricularia oryzae Y34]
MKIQNLSVIITAAMAFPSTVQARENGHADNVKLAHNNANLSDKTYHYSTYELSNGEWVHRPEYSKGTKPGGYEGILGRPYFIHLDKYCNPSYPDSKTKREEVEGVEVKKEVKKEVKREVSKQVNRDQGIYIRREARRSGENGSQLPRRTANEKSHSLAAASLYI